MTMNILYRLPGVLTILFHVVFSEAAGYVSMWNKNAACSPLRTLLVFNGGANLDVLETDQLRLLPFSMVASQRGESFLSSIVGNEPPGRLREEPNRA
jgi:hypothetical protein